MKIICIIPARLESKRFPRKLLQLLDGKPLIQHAYEHAKAFPGFDDVLVATDSLEIARTCRSFAGNVLVTSDKPRNGTERCAEALEMLIERGIVPDIIVNAQADEIGIHGKLFRALIGLISTPGVRIATLITSLTNQKKLEDENVVKVLLYEKRTIKEFSRQPYLKAGTQYKHIGLYAYCSGVLLKIAQEEMIEAERNNELEQLRWLKYNHTVHYRETFDGSFSVNTPEDLKELEQWYSKGTRKEA